jgi:uncharacterized membrane protein YgcG
MHKWLRLCLLGAWCAAAAWAVNWKALRPQGCTSDFAGVIDIGSKSELETYCAKVERATGVQPVLVVVGSLQREPATDVARAIFDAWKDPTKQPDQRVMLLLSISDRRTSVVASDALPPEITNGLAGRVLREASPALRQKDYSEALRAAAETIGTTAAQARNVPLTDRPARRIQPSFLHWLRWPTAVGAVLLLAWLVWLQVRDGLIRRPAMSRQAFGSRGSGGFGGYDSGDSFGGFGGGPSVDW